MVCQTYHVSVERLRDPGLALVSLIAATLVALALKVWLAVENPSSVYLLSVAAVALLAGTPLAISTAVGAFLLYNFLFVEPRFTLAVADPQSLLTLLLLLVIGLVVGRLTSIGRDRADESARREREARALFAVTRVLATAPRADQALSAIAERIVAETEMIGSGSASVSLPPPSASSPTRMAMLLRRPATSRQCCDGMLTKARPDGPGSTANGRAALTPAQEASSASTSLLARNASARSTRYVLVAAGIHQRKRPACSPSRQTR